MAVGRDRAETKHTQRRSVSVALRCSIARQCRSSPSIYRCIGAVADERPYHFVLSAVRALKLISLGQQHLNKRGVGLNES
jgi:hypothetical protein